MELRDVVRALFGEYPKYDYDGDDFDEVIANNWDSESDGSDYVDWNEIGYGLSKPKEIAGLGTVQTVKDHGGGEGSGEERYVVIKVTDNQGNETYYRKDGYYASYDGSTFDGEFREVTPRDRVVTFYE